MHEKADSPASQAVLQDMLQVWRQEPDLCYEMQEMPQRPDEAEEQDAGSAVNLAADHFRFIRKNT